MRKSVKVMAAAMAARPQRPLQQTQRQQKPQQKLPQRKLPQKQQVWSLPMASTP